MGQCQAIFHVQQMIWILLKTLRGRIYDYIVEGVMQTNLNSLGGEVDFQDASSPHHCPHVMPCRQNRLQNHSRGLFRWFSIVQVIENLVLLVRGLSRRTLIGQGVK